MCPPLATQDSVLGCPLLAHRQVVSLFVCFSLSRLVQACSCSCSNSAQCSLNLALPSSILSQLHQGHYWFCPFPSAELADIKGVCACLWAEEQFVTKIKQRVVKGMLVFPASLICSWLVLLPPLLYALLSAPLQSISHFRAGLEQNWEPLLSPRQQIYSVSCCLATLVSSSVGG